MFSRISPGWPVRPPQVRWGLREAFVCLVVAQVAAVLWFVAASTVFGELGFSDDGIAFLLVGTFGLWLAYFFGPGYFSRSLGQGPLVDFDIGTKSTEAIVAVAVGVGLQLVVLPLLYWPISQLVDRDPGESAKELIEKVGGPGDVVLFAVAVVLIAPVVEERFYRGMLLPALSSTIGPVLGILGSSLVFALVHQELILIPGLMVLAAVLGWMTATTARIGPATVAHMAFNATTVVQLLVIG